MGLSKTALNFLSDEARAAMLAPWRNDVAYVAVPSYAVGSDGNVYRSMTANGVDEDGNNVGPGAVNPVGDTTNTWQDFTSDEVLQDLVGDMFTSNTETNITSTYDDANGKITLNVPPASESVQGVVEKATNAEAIAGTQTTTVTTPAGVSAAINAIASSSETQRGLVELASASESTAGTDNTRAITPLRLQEKINALPAGLPASRRVNTTAPIRGGGDLSADRTISIDTATTSRRGSVQLSTSTSSTSTTTAATSSAVRIAALSSSGIPTGAGGVRTYAMLEYTRRTFPAGFGATVAGSQLSPSSVTGIDNRRRVGGTWRCMGIHSPGTSNTNTQVTVWVRIS